MGFNMDQCERRMLDEHLQMPVVPTLREQKNFPVGKSTGCPGPSQGGEPMSDLLQAQIFCTTVPNSQSSYSQVCNFGTRFMQPLFN